MRGKPGPSKRNIYLVGFMGSGKSTVGPLAARALGWDFHDSDREIVRTARKSVPEIFLHHGEEKFREIESRVIRKLSRKKNTVVSLGGGALLREENRKILFSSGTLIYLQARSATLLSRLKRSKEERPLLSGKTGSEKLKTIRELLTARQGAYREADITLRTDGKTALSLARQIAKRVRA